MLKSGTIITGALAGVEAFKVQVSATVTTGGPGFAFAGGLMADAAVRECRIRVESAIKSEGFTFPTGLITVEVKAVDASEWPTGRKVDGTGLDLPIALAVLVASGQLPGNDEAGSLVAFGELSLTGQVRPVRGAILLARLRSRVLHRHNVAVLCPAENGAEAVATYDEPNPGIRCVRTLRQAASTFATGEVGALPTPRTSVDRVPSLDFRDIAGQQPGRRAAEIAAAGGHNLLLTGGPGAGKTMLARRITGILPDMTEGESIRVTEVHSVAGLNVGGGRIASRPFRAPHHSTTPAGLVGGGASVPRPGEVSLATHGVLFLDETPEFARTTLEVLREPLTTGAVVLSRASGTLRYPADTMLVASRNPCPCGRAGTPRCACSAEDVKRYAARSHAVEALCDVRCEVAPVNLDDETPREDSATIKARVVAARAAQGVRGCLNARMSAEDVHRELSIMTPAATALLAQHATTAADQDRTIRVARTIADLAGLDAITYLCVFEALQLTK